MNHPFSNLIEIYAQLALKKQTNNKNNTLTNKEICISQDVSYNRCIFCECEDNLSSFNDKFIEKIKDCFYIQIKCENTLAMICELCVNKLENALLFRKQIESVEFSYFDGRKNVSSIVESFDDDYSDHNSSVLEEVNKTECFEEEIKKKTAPKLDKSQKDCPECAERFPNFRQLNRHYPIHFDHSLCDICGRPFLDKHLLKAHMTSHRNERIQCKACPKVYSSYHSMMAHYKMKHKGMDKIYCCTFCMERFSNYHQRHKHLVEVHGHKPETYECQICGKVYTMFNSYTAHLKQHQRTKKHVCTVCEKSFFTKYLLNVHFMKHTGERSFKCNICEKAYFYPKNLQAHIKTHKIY